MKFILVFFAVALADVFWTKYMQAVSDDQALGAAFWSALIIAMSAFTTVEYINDRRVTIAAVAGAFVGTYLTVWWRAHGKRKTPK